MPVTTQIHRAYAASKGWIIVSNVIQDEETLWQITVHVILFLATLNRVQYGGVFFLFVC